MVRPQQSVGDCSSVPYGPTNGYATPNGITGFIGPAAESLQQPVTWYVRSGGSNTNGGTSAALAPARTGSDGNITAGQRTFTSATAAFTTADVGSGIRITGAATGYVKIVAIVNSTTATVDHNWPNATVTNGTWTIGGAWANLTILNAGANNNPVATGDTIYVGAGTYRAVLSIASITPAFNGQVNIVGDVTGQYTGDAGMVQLTAYTVSDKTSPSGTTLLNLNGKSNLAFSNIMFVGGNATLLTATTAMSQNVSFTDCAFLAGYLSNQVIVNATAAANQKFQWVFNRCHFMWGSTTSNQITVNLPTSAMADYDCYITIMNCSLIGAGTKVSAVGSGTLTFSGGGIRIINCFSPLGQLTNTTASHISTIFPVSVSNSIIYAGQSNGILAGTLGQVVESYNLIVASTPRSNVAIGTGSISDGSYAPLFHFGQERIWGGLQRAFGEPMAGAPLLSFGNDGGQTLYDLMNRPRPEGGGSGHPYPAVGALERDGTAAQATSPSPPSGTHVWQFVGPASQPFLLPVSATPTTVSISVQRDSAYSAYPGGTLPALQILANGTLGVAAQTIVDTGGTGSWNTLRSAAFTPSGTGWVTVRLVSYDGTGLSSVSFADFLIT